MTIYEIEELISKLELKSKELHKPLVKTEYVDFYHQGIIDGQLIAYRAMQEEMAKTTTDLR
jgi:hypothetical protein